ncbi:MAG: DUF2950 domain-containing protein [Halioglobus sp.]
MRKQFLNRTAWAIFLALVLIPCSHFVAAQEHASFNTADEAVSALIMALEKRDTAMLATLLGPDSEDIFDSGDEVADANALADFLARYEAGHSLVEEGENTVVLQVGDNDWPLPVPIVERDGKWYLDGAAGVDEIVYRRIGRNELGAIAVCRGFVDAQLEYAAEGHDGNPAGLFAAKLRSDPGQHNGLFWPAQEGEPQSPVGEAVARAAAEGYRAVTGKRNPYHGYYYRMLYGQGSAADGGAQEYYVDGVLAQGVALIAWPADYGVSGVMSFMVNHDGDVYQKDMGEDTAIAVDTIAVFDPDGSWSKVDPDEDE